MSSTLKGRRCGRRSPAPGVDQPVEAWSDGRVQAHDFRAQLPLYRRSVDQARALRCPQREPPAPERAGRVTARYLVTKFQILPSSENIFLVTKDGWHPTEVDTKNPSSEWQWTKKTATLSFRNPKKDSSFYLEYDGRPDLFNPPQKVSLRIGDQTIGEFTADAKSPVIKVIPITASQLGAADMVDLTLDVDRTFAPGAGDPRDLGIRVYHSYLDPK